MRPKQVSAYGASPLPVPIGGTDKESVDTSRWRRCRSQTSSEPDPISRPTVRDAPQRRPIRHAYNACTGSGPREASPCRR